MKACSSPRRPTRSGTDCARRLPRKKSRKRSSVRPSLADSRASEAASLSLFPRPTSHTVASHTTAPSSRPSRRSVSSSSPSPHSSSAPSVRARSSSGKHGTHAYTRPLATPCQCPSFAGRKDAGAAELETIEAREEARWQSLSTGEKVSDFVNRHQYGLIVGSWATAMVGTFGYIMRNPYVLFSVSCTFRIRMRETH